VLPGAEQNRHPLGVKKTVPDEPGPESKAPSRIELLHKGFADL